jgi:hypothetical protein
MMRKSKIDLLFAWLVVLISFSAYLGASTVTAGYIQATSLGAGAFALSGSGFTADGRFDVGAFPVFSCNGCAPGTSLRISAFELGNDFRNGSATIGGQYYPNVIWGDLYAEGPSVFQIFGPDIVLNKGAGTYLGTFSFAGSLCGVDPNVSAIPDPCIVQLGLGGTGIVSVDVSEAVELLWVDQVTYTFVTPEPGTLALLGSAILGLGAAFRRRFIN